MIKCQIVVSIKRLIVWSKKCQSSENADIFLNQCDILCVVESNQIEKSDNILTFERLELGNSSFLLENDLK